MEYALEVSEVFVEFIFVEEGALAFVEEVEENPVLDVFAGEG